MLAVFAVLNGRYGFLQVVRLAENFQHFQPFGLLTDIDEQIADGEKKVTEPIRQAVKDHGTLRDEEIQKYEECNKRFAELEAERLSIYRDSTVNIGYEIQASIQNVHGMTEQEMQQYMVDLDASLKQSNDAVNAACQAEIDRLNEYPTFNDEEDIPRFIMETWGPQRKRPQPPSAPAPSGRELAPKRN